MQTLIKEQADVLLALFGKSIKRSKALEVLSHCYGYPNWDTACKMDALDAYNNRAQHDFTELEAYLINCSLEATKLNAFIIGIFPYGLVFDNVDYIEQQTFLNPESYKAFWQSCTQVQTHVLKGANIADVLPRLIRTISGGHGYALNYSDNAYEAYLEAKGVISKNQHALPGKLQTMCSRLTKPIWLIDSNPKNVNNLLELKDNGARFVLNANNLNDDLLVTLGAQGSWLTTSEDGKIIEFVAASIVFGGVTPEHSSELIMLKAKRLTHLLMLSYREIEPQELHTHILVSEIFAMILVVLDDKDASMANVVNYLKRHTNDLGPSLYIKIKDDFEQTLSSLPSVNRVILRDALTHRQKDSSLNANNEAMGLITGRIEYFYQYSLPQDALDAVVSNINPNLSFLIKSENEYVPALDHQDVKDAIFKVSSAKQVKLPSEFTIIMDEFSSYVDDSYLRLRQTHRREREKIVLNDGFFLREPTKFDLMNRFQPLNALSDEIHDGDVRTESNIASVLDLSGLRLDQLITEELALLNLYLRDGLKAKVRVNIMTNASKADTSRAWSSQIMELLAKHLSYVYVYTPDTDPKNEFDSIGVASVDSLPDFVIRRLYNGDVKCNVGHKVSWRSVDMSLLSDFEFGYIGTSPHELSINMLYEMGILHKDVCRRLTSTFTEEVLNHLPNEGGIIKRREVYDWIIGKKHKIERIWTSEF